MRRSGCRRWASTTASAASRRAIASPHRPSQRRSLSPAWQRWPWGRGPVLSGSGDGTPPRCNRRRTGLRPEFPVTRWSSPGLHLWRGSPVIPGFSGNGGPFGCGRVGAGVHRPDDSAAWGALSLDCWGLSGGIALPDGVGQVAGRFGGHGARPVCCSGQCPGASRRPGDDRPRRSGGDPGGVGHLSVMPPRVPSDPWRQQ